MHGIHVLCIVFWGLIVNSIERCDAFVPTNQLRCTPSPVTTRIMSSSLPTPREAEGRKLPTVTWPVFLATAAITPVWATTFVPLTAVCLVGQAVLRKILPSSSTKLAVTNFDSGYVVESMIPRHKRPYDLVVLGATGFCGKLAVRYLAQQYGVNGTVKWAMAGRSEAKLEAVKKELAEELKMKEILEVDSIVVDTSIPSTLPKLVSQTRVVATTAGPFAVFGSPVVEFCAKYGTHYVDITGEVDWVKFMKSKWQSTAEKTGAKLVSFCGHDSIPWDLSVMKMDELLRRECGDELASATFWDESVGGAPGGTFATMLNAVEGDSLPKLDHDPFLEQADGKIGKSAVVKDLPLVIAKSRSPWDDSSSSHWTAPFIMASVNAGVVSYSQALRGGSHSLVYKETSRLPDFKTSFVNWMGFAIVGSLIVNPFTRFLLKKFVIPKSGEGPSMDDMEHKHFLSVLGQGVGAQGHVVETIMYLPKSAGCLETSRMMVESGLCLALQEDKLPKQFGGGFWTTSTALGDVLFQRLLQSGTVFVSQVRRQKA